MAKELVISGGRHETRVAILEDDQLVEIYFQRANEYSLAGSIHKGRVTRVLPGMQSAFVDLGLERDTFLYVSDFFEENDDLDGVGEGRGDRGERSERSEPRAEARSDRGGDRGERGRRGRGRDRGRDRSRDEAEPKIVEVTATSAELPPLEVLSSEEPLPVAAFVAPAAIAGSEDTSEDGIRRGRRRRRGRGPKGGNFPESKFADPNEEEEESAESEEELPVSPVVVSSESVDEPIVLPGESISKYARKGVEPLPPSEKEPEEGQAEAHEASVTPVHVLTPEVMEARKEAAVLEEVKEHLAEIAREKEEERDFEEAEQLVYREREEAEQDEDEDDEPADEPVVVEEADAEEVTEIVLETVESKLAEIEEAEDEVEAPEASDEAAEDSDESAKEPADEDGPLPSLGYSAHLRQAGDQRFLQQRAGSEEGGGRGRRRRRGRGGRDRVMAAGTESSEPVEANASTETELEPIEGVEAPMVELQGEVRSANRAPLRSEGRPEGRSDGRSEERGERSGRGRDGRGRGDREPRGDREARGEREPRGERSERGGDRGGERGGERRERRATPSITELLKEGQEILVQIAKEPLGQKGARITSHIALPGRYCVYMPTVDHTGVSRKIASDEERLRLKRILQGRPEGIPGGFIIRTAGAGRTEEEILQDIEFLHNLWMDIRRKAESRPAPSLIYHDLEIVERVLRDQLGPDFKAIWVDTEETYESILRFLERFQPAMVSRVKLYTRTVSIFDNFGITAELEKALRPKVWLKSGGYIVINQTEALVAIDINTGKFVGKSNRLEDTIVKTNIEAIKEIVRQIRLRDLGGIIVIDFIDMDERKNRMRVMQALEEAMGADRAPYKILQFNDFGLVAITRKRVKQSLERTLCSPCPYCEGSGYVKSVSTVVSEILNEAKKLRAAVEDAKDVILRVNPEVAKLFKSSDNNSLEELEEILGRPVAVVSDPLIHQEKFDLA